MQNPGSLARGFFVLSGVKHQKIDNREFRDFSPLSPQTSGQNDLENLSPFGATNLRYRFQYMGLVGCGRPVFGRQGSLMAEAASNIVAAPTPYRSAPHNVEAEQALLGAILVNNDAFYRVSDFLEPDHLYEPLHRQIYKVTADMIRAGKRANPVTIKTFLPEDEKIGH